MSSVSLSVYLITSNIGHTLSSLSGENLDINTDLTFFDVLRLLFTTPETIIGLKLLG